MNPRMRISLQRVTNAASGRLSPSFPQLFPALSRYPHTHQTSSVATSPPAAISTDTASEPRPQLQSLLFPCLNLSFSRRLLFPGQRHGLQRPLLPCQPKEQVFFGPKQEIREK